MTIVTDEQAAAASQRPVWRDRDFGVFWVGQSVSQIGTQFTVVALPLVAAQTLQADATGVGVIQASTYASYLAVPLLAGVMVDRIRKRPLMLGTNVARCALVLAVPLLAYAGLLNLPLLAAIAIAVGGCTVLFDVAELAYIPLLVGRDRLVTANSFNQAASAASDLAGPGMAGVLIAIARTPLVALFVDAVSYVISVISLALIRKPEARPQPTEQRIRTDIADGFRHVLGTHEVRAIALQGLLYNCGSFTLLVAFLLHALENQEAGAAWYGMSLTAGGAGALVGAALAARMATRYGYGPAFIAGVVLDSFPFLLIPLSFGPDFVTGVTWMAAFAIANVGLGLVNVVSYTIRQGFTPDHLLGRMSASIRQVLYAGIPVGSILGGVLTDVWGTRFALTVGILLMIASLVPIRTLSSLRDLPQPAA